MSQYIYVKHKLVNIIKISKIISIHYFELDKDYYYSGESHDFWEIVYVDKGEIIITAGEKTSVLKQGEAVFHKPDEFHNIQANKKIAPNVFIITFDANSHAMKYFEGKILKLPPDLIKLISQIIIESKQAFYLPCFDPQSTNLKPKKNAPVGSQQLIRLYLEQFLILLLRDNTTKAKTKLVFESKVTFDNHIVSSIMKCLEDNIYNSITVSQICADLHYGTTYLSNVFKDSTGYGIKEYYSMLKIAEAKRLIREHNYTFSEMADLLHFESPQYFSKRFKMITGMTPKEYLSSVIK